MPSYLKWIFLVLVICYGMFSIAFANRAAEQMICRAVYVQVKDSAERNLLNSEQLNKIVQVSRKATKKKEIANISLHAIEQAIKKDRLIKEVRCHFTPSGTIFIELWQVRPILRCQDQYFRQYYMDDKGHLVSIDHLSPFRTTVASGYIDQKTAKEKLLPLIRVINESDFWKTQFQQIVVNERKDISLIPLVGDYVIHLGSVDDLEKKFENLKYFYDHVLSKIGWNQYRVINLKYKNQIVCSKTAQSLHI